MASGKTAQHFGNQCRKSDYQSSSSRRDIQVSCPDPDAAWFTKNHGSHETSKHSILNKFLNDFVNRRRPEIIKLFYIVANGHLYFTFLPAFSYADRNP